MVLRRSRRRSYRRRPVRTVRRRSRRRSSPKYYVESFPKIKPGDYNEGFQKPEPVMPAQKPKSSPKNINFKNGFKEGFKEGVEHFRRSRQAAQQDDEDY